MELLTRSSTKWPPTLTSTVDRAVASMTVRDKIDAAKKELGAVVPWSDKQADIYPQVHPCTQMALGLLTGAAQVCPSGWLRHASHITVR